MAIFHKGSGYWQLAVTSESSLETAGCLQRTFAGDSQLKYMDGIWTKKSITKWFTDFYLINMFKNKYLYGFKYKYMNFVIFKYL